MKNYYDKMKKKGYKQVGKYNRDGDDIEKILIQISDELSENFGINFKYELYNCDLFIKIVKPKDVE